MKEDSHLLLDSLVSEFDNNKDVNKYNGDIGGI